MFAPETVFLVRQEQVKDRHRQAKHQTLVQSVEPPSQQHWIGAWLIRWAINKAATYHQETTEAVA